MLVWLENFPQSANYVIKEEGMFSFALLNEDDFFTVVFVKLD